MHTQKSFIYIASVAFFFATTLISCAPLSKDNAQINEASELNPDFLAASYMDEVSTEESIAEISLDVRMDTEENVPAEPEQTVAQELEELESLGDWKEGEPAETVKEAEIEYDFPVTINRQVEYYLDFFQNKHRKSFARWLKRSGTYLPMIHEELKNAGLPLDLAYLAMIESGYSRNAYSRARAVGLWQFIRSTGKHYNLTIDSYVDERKDPVKSTRAAVRYLSDLYEEFGSWHLAVAGYNAGEGKIRRAIRKYNTTDFWELAQGKYLKLETKRYVPKLIAAIIISKDPEKYGFVDVKLNPPFSHETVRVPRWTSLSAVALACDVKPDKLRNLNLELLRSFTPPDKASYEIKVPAGKKEQLVNNLPRVHATVTTSYKTHKVRKKESLSGICRRYGLTKTIILKANNLRSSTLKAGQRLRIPYRTTKYELLPEGKTAPQYVADTSKESFILHKIKPGETVSELSTRYNVPAHLIAGWNDLRDISRIRAGRQLALYVKKEGIALPVDKKTSSNVTKNVNTRGASDSKPGQMANYEVKSGDSLWTIARRYNLSVSLIRQWNDLSGNTIYPGDSLLLPVKTLASYSLSGKKETYYKVRSGDSLWIIARRFNLTLRDIKRWNNLRGNVIYPGNQLLIKIDDVDV